MQNKEWVIRNKEWESRQRSHNFLIPYSLFLISHFLWTLQGTILRPPDYESGALTSWAKGPDSWCQYGYVILIKNFIVEGKSKELK